MVRRRLRTLVVAALLGLGAAGADMLTPALHAVTVHIPLAHPVVASLPNTTADALAAPGGQRSNRRPRSKPDTKTSTPV